MKIKDLDNNEKHTIGEEITNSITHGFGILFGIVALILLIIFSSKKGSITLISTIVYGISLIVLYLISTLYHGIQHKKTKKVFEILDHIAVYLLIAGTYTPFALLIIKGMKGWILLVLIWFLAIVGISIKPFTVKKFLFLSTAIYIFMGWIAIFLINDLIANLNAFQITTLILGGVFYTVGTFFYVFRKIKYGHFIWHLFVLFGSISHFITIFSYIL
ncbi:MAG: hemolysin III family protein [Candidatus Woesearchaeota archaeon]